jgi:general stress protein 26
MDIQADRDAAIKKLAEFIGEIQIAMLTTTSADGSLRSRPMRTQRAKFDGQLWFFTSRESRKAEEIVRHPQVSLSYAGPDGHSYVWVSGRAELISDRKKADELWDERYREWFTIGPNDPHLAIIRVTVEQAEYWHAAASSPLDAAFFVLAPERREDPEFHSKVALLKEFGPVIAVNVPDASSGMFHPALYHRAFPHLCGSGETPREAAEKLIGRLTNEKDIHAEYWQQASVERAIAEVRAWLGMHS